MTQDDILRLAISHHNAGRVGEAERLYRDILRQWPGHPVAATLLARLALRAGQLMEARSLLTTAIAGAPDYMQAHAAMADCLEQTKETALAVRSFRRALALVPGQATPMVSLGNLSQLDNNDGPAATLYQRALTVQPRSIAAANNLAAASLKLGNPNAALEATDRVLAHSPGHVRATAYRTAALRALGRDEQVDALIGLDRLVRIIEIDIGDSHGDIATFNAELVQALETHPNLSRDWDPTQRAIRGGAIVPKLLTHRTPVLQAFEQKLRAAIDDAISALPDDPTHPYLAHKPRAYDLDAWANFLGRSDHQSAHIHNLGWMSGVYYVAIPAADPGPEENPRAGWIEFNRPGYGIPNPRGEAGIKTIQPRPGMAILFPSYVWHGTIPFKSSGQRISIAFDLHPRTS